MVSSFISASNPKFSFDSEPKLTENYLPPVPSMFTTKHLQLAPCAHNTNQSTLSFSAVKESVSNVNTFSVGAFAAMMIAGYYGEYNGLDVKTPKVPFRNGLFTSMAIDVLDYTLNRGFPGKMTMGYVTGTGIGGLVAVIPAVATSLAFQKVADLAGNQLFFESTTKEISSKMAKAGLGIGFVSGPLAVSYAINRVINKNK